MCLCVYVYEWLIQLCWAFNRLYFVIMLIVSLWYCDITLIGFGVVVKLV